MKNPSVNINAIIFKGLNEFFKDKAHFNPWPSHTGAKTYLGWGTCCVASNITSKSLVITGVSTAKRVNIHIESTRHMEYNNSSLEFRAMNCSLSLRKTEMLKHRIFIKQ